jgi:hypothetical protein
MENAKKEIWREKSTEGKTKRKRAKFAIFSKAGGIVPLDVTTKDSNSKREISEGKVGREKRE